MQDILATIWTWLADNAVQLGALAALVAVIAAIAGGARTLRGSGADAPPPPALRRARAG